MQPYKALLQRSAVLSTFPWLTDFLLEKNGTVVSNKAFERMFNVLEEFEIHLFRSCSLEVVDFRAALSIVDPTETQMPTNPPHRRHLIASRLSHLLSLYKIVDILHALNRPVPSKPGRNPLYARMNAIGVPRNTKAWPIIDWVQSLRDGNTFLTTLGHSWREQASTSSAVKTLPSENMPSMSEDVAVKLFHDLHLLSEQTNASTLLFNVQLAAVHLWFIFKGFVPKNTLLPDLPTTVEDLESMFSNGTSPLSPEQLGFIKSLMKKYDTSQRRYTLHVALLVSPVALLTKRKLLSRRMDQRSLLEIAKALGNCKPDLLLKIEYAMWNAILSIATGQSSAYDAMCHFFKHVPWDMLNSVDKSDRNFFKPDTQQQINVSLLSRETEGQANQDWLLARLRPQLSAPATSMPEASAGDDMDVDDPFPSGDSVPSTQENAAARQAEQQIAPSSEGPNRDPADMVVDHAQKGNSLRAKKHSPRNPKSAAKKISSEDPQKPPRELRKKEAEWAEHYTPYVEVWPGAYLEPVDRGVYLAVPDITFKPKADSHLVTGRQVQLFPPAGDSITWLPQFHFKSDFIAFETFERYVKRFFVNDLPRHAAAPSESLFAIVSQAQYNDMTVEDVQTLHRTKHIVITGQPEDSVRFDSKGLRHLTNLDAPITLQDQSIEVTDRDYSRQVCKGTLRQLLEASRMESGPIVNALSFPSGLSGIQPSATSSEVEAWQLTEGLKFCPSADNFPVGEMRWGLAATRGARDRIHVDSDGLGTFIDVKCGGKLWIVFGPPANQDKHAFGSINRLMDKFDMNGIKDGRWAIENGDNDEASLWIAEAVYLSRGTRLIMRPNTPHAVFTTDHSIAFGGHFYSTSNLQDSCHSIVHRFMANGLVTNNEHVKTRRLLMRMMQYFYKCFVVGVEEEEYSKGHLPDLLNINSMIDMLTLCNFCYLANVLDSRTYSFPFLSKTDKPSARELDQRAVWDYNAMSTVDRDYFTYIRGHTRNFIKWLSCHYDATSAQSDEPMLNLERDFCGRYLMEQACAILKYKKVAEERLEDLSHCTFKDVERQVDYLFTEQEGMWCGDWKSTKANMENCNSLSFGDMSFKITKKDQPLPFTEVEPMKIGMSVGDKKFKKGMLKGFPSAYPVRHHDTVVEPKGESDEDFYASSCRASKRKRP